MSREQHIWSYKKSHMHLEEPLLIINVNTYFSFSVILVSPLVFLGKIIIDTKNDTIINK